MESPARPCFDLPRIIQGQTLNGRTADTGQALKENSVGRPTEMARPSLTTGMEERRPALGRWVEAGLKGQFLKLTAITAQSQVSLRRRSTAALGHDMVQTQAVREKALRRMAILATMARTSGHRCVEPAKIRPATLGHLIPWTFFVSAPCGLRQNAVGFSRSDLPIGACVRLPVIHVNEPVQVGAILLRYSSQSGLREKSLNQAAAFQVSARWPVGRCHEIGNECQQRFDRQASLGSSLSKLEVQFVGQ